MLEVLSFSWQSFVGAYVCCRQRLPTSWRERSNCPMRIEGTIFATPNSRYRDYD